MASPEGYYTPVLVPERHAEAVEKYVKDLETLDELRDSAHAHDGVDRPTLFASAETLDELRN